MDAYPIKWILLVAFYGAVVLWGSQGSPYGTPLIAEPSTAILIGQIGAGIVFMILPFMERSVFYFSSRMLLTAATLRLTAGGFFFLIFSLEKETLRQFLLAPTSVEPKPNEFYFLWVTIVGAIFASLFLRYLKHRQKRFIHLEG